MKNILQLIIGIALLVYLISLFLKQETILNKTIFGVLIIPVLFWGIKRLIEVTKKR
jgi:hypothetical protein